MTTQQLLTPHQSQYFAWLLTRRAAGDSVESLASTLVDSQVDLNPHQVEAALFACRNPLSRGVILADEVGLGKTIEAGLVISQRWAERRRKMLIIVPANLRKQWHQELQDKFGLQGLILEAKNYNAIRKQERQNPFLFASGPIICSYQFAKAKADDVKGIDWDLVVLDEAHRLRNVYKTSNVIAKTLKEALSRVHSKVLLTATPLQNSLLELYGLVSFIDDRVFGDLDSFRSQFTGREQSFSSLRDRLAPICKRTLRKQVQPYVSYTARRAIVEEFTPSSEEQELSRLVADYLRRPNLKALPDGQRQLISLVLWKLLASSTHAIAGALETMAKRLQGVLDQAPVVPDLAEELDEDYESLDETADEWEDQEPGKEATNRSERDAVAQEIEELRHFKTLATNIRDNAKGNALLTALVRAFAELDRLGAARKAIIFTESRRTQEYLLNLLADTPYGDGIVLFNGTNSDQRAQAIYKDWLKRHEGTDRITGSKTADTRAALVEHFKERGKVMIATEAGAEGSLDELGLQNQLLQQQTRRFIAAARLRRHVLLKALGGNGEVQLPPVPLSPLPDLGQLQTTVRSYAAELRKSADADERKKLEADFAELSDRALLAGMLPVVTDEIQRLKTIRFLTECAGDTATNTITKMGNDIADTVITPRLRDRFQEEIVRLAASKVRVEIVRSGGKYGSPQYQVRLFAKPDAKVHEILSEGEKTCVALAAFMTELATAMHRSALVFDDPVSSLDHRWRGQVAKRLVEEAENRQVIVFTHDLVFVNDLNDHATKTGRAVRLTTLSRGAAGAGMVADGLPWKAQSVEDRIDKLEKAARAAKLLHDNNQEDEYAVEVAKLYNSLRATWERGLEDIAFVRVIQRHRDYINARDLKKVSALTEADCYAFAAGFKKCCDIVDAHDPSSGRNAVPPPPADLFQDIQALKNWAASLRDRQKKIA